MPGAAGETGRARPPKRTRPAWQEAIQNFTNRIPQADGCHVASVFFNPNIVLNATLAVAVFQYDSML